MGPSYRSPFPKQYPFYVLIETGSAGAPLVKSSSTVRDQEKVEEGKEGKEEQQEGDADIERLFSLFEEAEG